MIGVKGSCPVLDKVEGFRNGFHRKDDMGKRPLIGKWVQETFFGSLLEKGFQIVPHGKDPLPNRIIKKARGHDEFLVAKIEMA